jgi:hypothetical protein
MFRSYGVTAALLSIAFGVGLYVGHGARADAQTRSRVLEIRTYTANEGKLEALVERMRNGESQLFEKHGMKGVVYSVAAEPPRSQNTFVYILAHESIDAAKKSWDGFRGDPAWESVRAKSEVNGRLVAKADVIFVNPSNFSPVK